ncbi:unnamed protein product [Caenorhabditis sp. 36 PRJEB53466]|nr:unnamed protein product [Caenorhabditis sp. 36 PRJEB53466]
MCSVSPKCIPLPEQQIFCSVPSSACRYVEVKAGRSKWEKRSAVFVQSDGEPPKIVIYTKPLVGQIYPLTTMTKMTVKQDKEAFIVDLATEKRLKVTFRIDGKEAAMWAGAVVSRSFGSLGHITHQNYVGSTSNIGTDLKEEPNVNVYTGTREGYVGPQRDSSMSDDKKKKGNRNENGEAEEKKKESVKKLKKTASTSGTKKSSTESKSLAATQELPPAKFEDTPTVIVHTDSEPDVHKTKQTQEANETATSSGKCVEKKKKTTPLKTTPVSITPATLSLTPGNEEKEKKRIKTDSDECEAPGNKP